MGDLVIKDKIVIYQDGEIELEVSIANQTIWLTQKEIALLFEKNRTVITKHINNILSSNEVIKKSNVQKMHLANSDKPVKFYSLDIVLAVGYRTNSVKSIKFRQWATKVLKQYVYRGYTINSEKITHQRFKEIEKDVDFLKQKIQYFEDQHLSPHQGIFFNGQVFDAHKFVSDLIKSTKNKILLIDNYVDYNTLLLFSELKWVEVLIYTSNISDKLKLDLKKFNEQYFEIKINEFDKSHDRFLIIDKEVYHFGASLKDLGKKWFAFSRLDIGSLSILDKLPS